MNGLPSLHQPAGFPAGSGAIGGTTAGRTLVIGLMAAWTIGGVLLADTLPVFGAVIMALAGLPALLVVLAWGGVWFAAYGFITLLATFWGAGIQLSLLLILLLLFPAAILAGTIQRFRDPISAIAAALLVATLTSSLFWGISPLLGSFGQELWALGEPVRELGRIGEGHLQEMEKQKGIDTEKLWLLRDQIRTGVDFLLMLVPITFLFVWHLITLSIFYFGAEAAAPVFRFGIEPFPQFSMLRFNWNLVWVLFAGWLLFYGTEHILPGTPGFLLKATGANLLAISKTFYFISGISLMFFFCQSHKLGRPWRIGLSMLAFLFHQLPIWLGIIDIWADFRTPRPVVAKTDDDDGSFF
jgi:hypothetical protein